MNSYRNTTLNISEEANVFYGGICGLRDDTGVKIYTMMLILLAALSTVENLIVLIVICRDKVLRTPSLILLGILAGIDLLTGCVVTPIKACVTLQISYFYPLIRAFLTLFLAAITLSLSTVMLISLDRFFHVYFLDNYNPTKKKMLIALLCSWFIPILFILLEVSGVNPGFGGSVFALLYFFACILIMIIAYAAQVVTLKKHSSNAYYDNRQDMIENQRKAVKTVLIIVTTFVAMNIVPILSIAFLFMGVFSSELCAITFFVMLMNSAVNPLIYWFRIPVMKDKVSKLLRLRTNSSRNEVKELRNDSVSAVNQAPFVITNDENKKRREGTQTGQSSKDNAEDNRGLPVVGSRDHVNRFINSEQYYNSTTVLNEVRED